MTGVDCRQAHGAQPRILQLAKQSNLMTIAARLGVIFLIYMCAQLQNVELRMSIQSNRT